MRKLIFSLLIASAPGWSVAYVTNNANAHWNTSAHWTPNGIPTAGDTVQIGTGHTLTIDAGYTAQVGLDSGTDAAATPAIACASNSSNTSVLIINGTLEYAGPVRQCGNSTVTWSAGPGAQIKHAGTTVQYSWSTYNTSGGLSKLSLNGTSGSHVTWGKKVGAVNAGPLGAYTGVFGALNGNGNIWATYTDFSDIGSASIDAVYAKIFTGQTLTWDHVTFTASGKINIEYNSASAGIDWNSVSISGSLSSTPYGMFASVASNTTTRRVQNSFLQGAGQMLCSNGTWLMDLTINNVLTRTTATGNGFGTGGNDCPGTVSGMMFYSQSTSDTSSLLQPGTASDLALVRYVNFGQVNVHPVDLSLIKQTNITGLVADGNTGHDSDRLQVRADPATVTTFNFSKFLSVCNHQGKSQGALVNFDGTNGSTSKVNTRIAFTNSTGCSELNAALDHSVLLVGGENAAITFGPSTYSAVANNIAWSPVAAVVRMICFGNGTWDSAALAGVANNNIFNNTDTSGYCDNALAAGATAATDTTNDPRFVDTTRHFAVFDQRFLGDSLVGAQWTNGSTYNAGELVWDQQSANWGNQQINWRATATCTASSTNRPITGSGWMSCWEPAAVQRVRDLVLTGQTTWAGKATQYQGKGVIAAYVQWISDGLVPQNPIIWAGGTSSTYQGGADPVLLRMVTGII
jgi:hypothetical protein